MQIVTTLALGARVVAVRDQLLQVLLLIAVKVQVLFNNVIKGRGQLNLDPWSMKSLDGSMDPLVKVMSSPMKLIIRVSFNHSPLRAIFGNTKIQNLLLW